MSALGSLAGYDILWEDAKEGLGAAGKPVADASFVEVPRATWRGPVAQNLTLQGHLGGSTAYALARSLARLAGIVPFVPVEHPNGVFLDETTIWLQNPSVGVTRTPAQAGLNVKGQYAGNPKTMDVGVVTLSRAIPNAFSQAQVTPMRIPATYVPRTATIGDAARNVVQTPTWFTSFDAGYTPGDWERNGLQPVLLSAQSAPANWLVGCARAILAGADVWGSGDDLLAATLQNIALNVTFPSSRIRFADRLGGVTTTAVELNPGAFTDVAHLGGGLPSTPWEQDVHLSNGALIEVSDSGNAWFFPKDAAGFTITTPASGTARALGSGAFYHQYATHLYLVSDSDWAVTTGGAVSGYSAGARFAIIFTAATGATLNKRLREAYAETSTQWVLVARGRSL